MSDSDSGGHGNETRAQYARRRAESVLNGGGASQHRSQSRARTPRQSMPPSGGDTDGQQEYARGRADGSSKSSRRSRSASTAAGRRLPSLPPLPPSAPSSKGFFGSLLFPTVSPPANDGGDRGDLTRASTSTTDTSRFADDDELLRGVRAVAYGDPRLGGFSRMDADNKSLKMGGSRPPSVADGKPGNRNRTTRSLSVASSMVGGGGEAPGYLFLHEQVGSGGQQAQLVSEGGGAGTRKSGGRDLKKERRRSQAASLLLMSENQDRKHKGKAGEGWPPGVPAVPRVPSAYGCYNDVQFNGASEHLETPQQAWYLLRTLVGLELKHEFSRAWKLVNLDAEAELGYDERQSWEGGSETTDEDSIFSAEDESEDPARELPILRYLVKNFLLTLPIVRDTVALPPDGEEDSRGSLFGGHGSGQPIYWSAGLLPILRSLHQRNLSEPVDHGRRSLASIVGGIYGLQALERFVTAGLKLSSGTGEEDEEVEGEGEKGYANGSEAEGLERNRLERRSTLLNPLMDIRLPREPVGVSLYPSGLDLFSASAHDGAAEGRKTRGSRSGTLERASTGRSRFSMAGWFGRRHDTTWPSFGDSEERIERTPSARTSGVVRPPREPRRHTTRESLAVSESGEVGLVSPADEGEWERPDAWNESEGAEGEAGATPRMATPVEAIREGDERGGAPTVRMENANGGLASWLPSFFGGGAVSGGQLGTGAAGNRGETARSPIAPTTPGTESRSLFTAESGGAFGDDRLGSAFDAAGNPSGASAASVGYVVEDPDDFISRASESTEWSESRQSRRGHWSNEPVVYNSASVADEVGSPHAQDDTPQSAYRKRLDANAAGSALAPIANPSKRRFTLSIPGRKPRTSSLRPDVASPKLPVTSLDGGKKERFFAAMAVPSSVISPGSISSANRHGQAHEGEGEYPQQTTPSEQTASMLLEKGRSAPLMVPLVPKAGAIWPWGAPVPFWKGSPVHKVAWGGFEADIIGVRKTFTGHTFIVRVRRPQRLDEYVLRDEGQFKKYLAVLDKEYPRAHIRRIPSSHIRPEDDAVDPSALAMAMGSGGARRQTTVTGRKTLEGAGSTGGPTLRTKSPDLPHDENDGSAERRRPKSQHGKSRLANQLRDAALEGRLVNAPAAPSRGRSRTYSEPQSFVAPMVIQGDAGNDVVITKLPPYDPHRRALRSWLRDTLSVRGIGHHRETAAFLLLGSIVPKDTDLRDIRQRDQVDKARRQARITVAQGAAERARALYQWWHDVEEECIHGDGFLAFSEALRSCPTIARLPTRFQKSIEWVRMNMAQALHDLLVAGDHSGPLFAKLKAFNTNMPWFLIRNALKIPKPALMGKALQDILLSKPLGRPSLLQKMLSVGLDDDPAVLGQQIKTCRARIQSLTMCEKLTKFAYAPRETKNLIRRHAADNNLELVVTIVRGAEEPRLDKYDLDRVIRAAKTYKSFMKRSPSSHARLAADNTNVRLIHDLQIYLRLVSRERDADQIRELIAEESTAEALEVLVAPFFEFLKRTYKLGNAAQGIIDLQKFLDQLVIIVDALRSRIQDPQKSVRILARLLARHQQSLYGYLHAVHASDSIIEEFFQWLWTCAVFLRRGLATTVPVDAILPSNPEDRAWLLDEVDGVVAWHEGKRKRQYERLSRRYAADVDGDDPVVVEGDGFGKSRLEALTEPEPRMPSVMEIRRCLDSFRKAVVRTFMV